MLEMMELEVVWKNTRWVPSYVWTGEERWLGGREKEGDASEKLTPPTASSRPPILKDAVPSTRIGALPSRALSLRRSNKKSLGDDFGPESLKHAEESSISSV